MVPVDEIAKAVSGAVASVLEPSTSFRESSDRSDTDDQVLPIIRKRKANKGKYVLSILASKYTKVAMLDRKLRGRAHSKGAHARMMSSFSLYI